MNKTTVSEARLQHAWCALLRAWVTYVRLNRLTSTEIDEEITGRSAAMRDIIALTDNGSQEVAACRPPDPRPMMIGSAASGRAARYVRRSLAASASRLKV
jgi:hypothetical protein